MIKPTSLLIYDLFRVKIRVKKKEIIWNTVNLCDLELDKCSLMMMELWKILNWLQYKLHQLHGVCRLLIVGRYASL